MLGSLAIAAGGSEALPAFVKDELGPEVLQHELELDKAARTEALRIMGWNDLKTHITYWRAGSQTAWILEGRGRTGTFTAGFVIAENRIVNCRVLEYRESHGKAIKSKRFLRQFRKASLREDRQLDRRIHGITGATISVKSITNLARLALYYEQQAQPPAATP